MVRREQEGEELGGWELFRLKHKCVLPHSCQGSGDRKGSLKDIWACQWFHWCYLDPKKDSLCPVIPGSCFIEFLDYKIKGTTRTNTGVQSLLAEMLSFIFIKNNTLYIFACESLLELVIPQPSSFHLKIIARLLTEENNLSSKVKGILFLSLIN